MDIEGLKGRLKSEGFPVVYEWHDEAGKVYREHDHKDKVSFFVTRGNVSLFIAGEKIDIVAGERFDVPPKTLHTATVGEDGCSYVVGQMTEDD